MLLFTTSVALALATPAYSQRGRAGQTGGGTARGAAPVDLTGYWVSVVTEDWRYRMVTPKKGDHPSIPLNAEGVRVADSWDPGKDEAAGEQCKAYGAAGVMRAPGRVRISWQDDSTLKIETEAGTQTRLLHFATLLPAANGPLSWQGDSLAQWEFAGGRRGRGGGLKVVTTRMRPGYLQKNGVPYSATAVLTEYFNRTLEDSGDSWLILTAVVEDPRYLTGRFVRSTHYKKLPDTSPLGTGAVHGTMTRSGRDEAATHDGPLRFVLSLGNSGRDVDGVGDGAADAGRRGDVV